EVAEWGDTVLVRIGDELYRFGRLPADAVSDIVREATARMSAVPSPSDPEHRRRLERLQAMSAKIPSSRT
ncbi:MAG: hypothetical protein AAF211_30990, partial [Myxococcota bacterium]